MNLACLHEVSLGEIPRGRPRQQRLRLAEAEMTCLTPGAHTGLQSPQLLGASNSPSRSGPESARWSVWPLSFCL